MDKCGRFKQIDRLDTRLSQEVIRLCEEGAGDAARGRRDKLTRRARVAETAAKVSEWLNSPCLNAPT